MRDYTKILTIMVTLLMVGSCFILTTNPVVGYEMPPPEIVTCSELDYETETQESTLIAGETVFEVSYTFFEPDISVQNDRCSVTMTDTESYGDPGFPVLPTKTALIALPAGNVLTKVIVSGEIAQIELDLEVAWGQEPTAFGEEPEDDTPKNEFIYESVVPWPTKTFDVRKPMIWRGFNVQPVMLYPARYIPSENLLEYYTLMEVTLVMESLGGDVPDTYRGLEKDFALVGESVDNPSALKTYDEVAEIVQASTLVDPGLDYEYVIITGEEFIDNFTPFIQYKNDIGLKTTLVTVEDIYMNPAYDGIDEPDEIRNFVKDAYSTWGTEYILLGGDVEIVPERGVYLEYSSYVNHDVPCDNYFVSLDGDWNEDGDEVWGEVGEEDWYAELFVGRVTFDQGYELDNWINKTLRYDQGLTNNVDRVLLAGQQLNSYPTWGGNYMDNLQTHFPDDEPWNFTKLYNRDGTFSRQAIIDSLNEGNNLVNHMGHAGYSSNMGLSRSNVDELTNEDPYLIYSQGCMSGAFDDDFSGSDEGICEHHIFSEGGAFGVIMNARYGWYSGSSSGPSQWFHNPFIDALLGDYETSVGEANQYSKDQYVGYYDSYSVYRWIALELNYLGDPALIVNRPYLYEHDVGVTDLYAADMVSLGAEVPVRATLINTGRNAEDVTVEFLADDVLYDSQEITITHGASMLVEFTWEAPEIEGVHTLAIQLVLPEDEEPNDNYAKTIVEIADVVTVDDDGGADYRTISEAVAETEGNKVIYVNPGIYLESVYVDRSLRLQGSRNEMPVVGNVGEDAVFTLAADDIELRGFIMNGCSYGLVFDRCSGCIVEDNTIAKNSNGGVLFEEAVENTLRANTIEDNRMFEGGVGVLMHGSPENLITQNEIRDHADYGIRMDISDSLVIDNYIHDNNYGIWVQSGTAQITENNIRINKRGIGCTEMSYPNIVDNELCGNSWGIYAENGAYPTITDNRFCRCSDGNWVSYAVYLSRSGEVEIVGNDFDDINTGVYLEGSNAIINNNYFYKGYKGVDMRLDSYSIITENIFEENSYGIYSYMGSPMVENNNFDDQRCVYLYNSDDAIIQDNMFDEHYSGILLHESDAIVRDNVLQYGNNGITVWSGAPTLEGNIMNKHESYGLSIDYRAKETISNMSDNLIDGIDASLLYYYNEVDLNLEGYELSGLLTKHGIF
ncbi:MAG: right-handed parallel beta-helix repeat-containing protein, partial [Candidatus Peribacteraceae bacterium]|nr:right-handed parallel beta-helix repeat-containing protein [Candidatus Peribacteraceae bacterium]